VRGSLYPRKTSMAEYATNAHSHIGYWVRLKFW
jgi:hypothetical protein